MVEQDQKSLNAFNIIRVDNTACITTYETMKFILSTFHGSLLFLSTCCGEENRNNILTLVSNIENTLNNIEKIDKEHITDIINRVIYETYKETAKDRGILKN